MKSRETLSDTILLSTDAIGKTFGPTRAVVDVSIDIHAGTIMGLIGENGSGKSTLSSMIAGMQNPSMGTMTFLGNEYHPKNMIEAANNGVAMIVQEQGWVPGVSVAHNIFLGNERKFRRGPAISRRAMNRAANEVLQTIGFTDIDARQKIEDLDIQDRKLIEIARVMSADPRILIVDETTTALSQSGRTYLYRLMQDIRKSGGAVIFISHDLSELMEYCDEIAVMRDGSLITIMDRSNFDPERIKFHMVGRQMEKRYYRPDFDAPTPGEVILEVDTITTATGLLQNFSMNVRRGEILGIGGLSHCGMHELGKALFGEERLLTGSITHLQTNEKIRNPRQAIGLSMGYVSKDRDNEALVLAASIRDNIASGGLDKIAQGAFILPAAERRYVETQVSNLSIKCASIDQYVQFLSGGNKQKVVFGKWVGRDCDVLILDCPTRGVDIGVKAAMYALMDDIRHCGKTIIMISEELPELIGMSDRILILKNGSLSGEFFRSPELSQQQLISSMV